MRPYVSYSKERLVEYIHSVTSLEKLAEIRRELVEYGYSENGVLINKLERHVAKLRGIDVGPEPKWPGEDLPPITGEMRG